MGLFFLFLILALLFGVTAAVKGLLIFILFTVFFGLACCWSGYYWYRDRY